MRFQDLASTALALAPLVSAHGVILSAVGDASSTAGTALGVLDWVSRTDAKPYSGQLDTTVFAKPTRSQTTCKKCPIENSYNWKCKACRKPCAKKRSAIFDKRDPATTPAKKTAAKWCGKYIPNCKKCPNYDYNCDPCRTHYPSGCGRTVYTDPTSKLYTMDPGAKAGKKCCNMKNAFYTQSSLNVPAWMAQVVSQNKIPQVSCGGWLDLTVFQLNSDGGGPYTCILDQGGTGNSFSPLPMKILQNVPGVGGINKYTLTRFQLLVQIPTSVSCTGTYGTAKSVCMMRCNNAAPNGPFGGCIPFQVANKTPPTVQPTIIQPPPEPTSVNYTLATEGEPPSPSQQVILTGTDGPPSEDETDPVPPGDDTVGTGSDTDYDGY
ncbi:hypothetical protein TWF694_008129 [Orbilia ellipsospora]|uniref:Secreted protein n=1 Tax=Orbilia ellipsospora TaxID=2528407 RepID=A0AAV9XLU6_9PEZI